MMQYLQMVFDEVRLVDGGINYQYKVGEDGKYEASALQLRATKCGTGAKSENCISAKC